MTSVIIVGAGFGGMGVAIELIRTGFDADHLLILERSDDVGGVWRDNDYPAAGVDTPSPLYSYSYAPSTRWERRFAMRGDIIDYARSVAEEYRLRDRIRFGTEVVSARYDDDRADWVISTADGTTYRADIFVSAVGQLSQPMLPAVGGITIFGGEWFHSARWRHDVDLGARRVAIVGTGASAAQIIPGVVDQVGSLLVFQRHAPWVFPKLDTQYGRWRHARIRSSLAVQRAERLMFFLMLDVASLGLVDVPWLRRPLAAMSRRQLRRQIPDDELRARLTPDYEVGCKRVTFSNTLLPALADKHVTVVTDDIDEVTADGIRTVDGHTHHVDVIVYATGFRATEFLCGISVSGREGQDLQRAWAASGGATGYLGMTVPGFPNMFMVVGPNTSLSSGSLIYVIESQARYIRQAIAEIGRRGGAMEVRAEVAAAFDEEMQRKLRRSVLSRCSSWYRAEGGRVTSSWPDAVIAYRWRTRRLRLSSFIFHAPPATADSMVTVDPSATGVDRPSR